MATLPPRPRADVLTAMFGAAMVTAQFVAGKATRDALYLANLDVTTLPAMVIATSLLSIALVVLSSKVLRRVPTAVFVPALFLISALMLMVERLLVATSPALAARLVYLHISGFGPMLGSGFWLMATERFDPRTAKRRFGQIAGVGTLGGLLGGLVAERVAAVLDVSAMLPILSVVNLLCAWQARHLAGPLGSSSTHVEVPTDLSMAEAPSGFRVLAQAKYLQNLAAVVLLGTVAAALVDYAFKAKAVEAFGRGDTLLRFFAIFYAATSLVTFVVQTVGSRLALEKLGLGPTAGTPSLALLLGGVGAIFAPGVESVMIARGAESIFRGSLFRSSYELFYTPIPSDEKRAAKSLIDVGFDRLGEAAGGGLIRLALMAGPADPTIGLLWGAILCSLAAIGAASRLSRDYVKTLERGLRRRAVELDAEHITDRTTRTTFFRLAPLTGGRTRLDRTVTAGMDGAPGTPVAPPGSGLGPSPGPTPTPGPAAAPYPPRAAGSRRDRVAVAPDAETLKIIALRSRNLDEVRRLLGPDERLTASLVPHVVPLLAWDPLASDAITALRQVAETHVGQLVDALVDPTQDFTIRRRLPKVFSTCLSQRAVDGLLLGLDDKRFEVRFQCARALAAIHDKNPAVRIDEARVFEIVQAETKVGRPVWESQRLLHQLDDRDDGLFVDEFVKDRAGRSLAHVFTLLSLVLPTEPLRIAFRGLQTDDPGLRGTALEYLEGVLPARIRNGLWPFLDDARPRATPARAREDILADLLRSNQSIAFNLEELKRRGAGTT